MPSSYELLKPKGEPHFLGRRAPESSEYTYARHVVIAGNGPVANMLMEELSDIPGLIHAKKGKILYALYQRPQVIFAATPNPVTELCEEIADSGLQSTYLVLLANGANVMEQAREALGGTNITPIRASLYTTVYTASNGEVMYGKKKKRISLAVSEQDHSGAMGFVGYILQDHGFQVLLCGTEVKAMEMAKMISNTVGITTMITLLDPYSTFLNKTLWQYEGEGIDTRFRIIREGKLPFMHIPWAKSRILETAARYLPRDIPYRGREFVADLIASARDGRPSRESLKVADGKQALEAPLYLAPFIRAGRSLGIATPVDDAIYFLLMKHNHGQLLLNTHTPKERIEKLSEYVELARAGKLTFDLE